MSMEMEDLSHPEESEDELSDDHFYYIPTVGQPLKEIEIGPEIGSGVFGTVYSCSAKREEQREQFACKLIPIENVLWPIRTFLQIKVDNVLNQMSFLRQLSHPNLTIIYDMLGVHDFRRINSPMSYITLFMDECTNNLTELLHHLGPNGMPEKLCKHWFQQIVGAVEYVHDKGVTHLNICPLNVLFVSEEWENAPNADLIPNITFKLADTGVAQICAPNKQYNILSDPYLCLYGAPQIRAQEHNRINLKACDIFSLGMTLARCLVWVTNDENKALADFIRSLRDGTYKKNPKLSRTMGSFLKRMTKESADQRPNIGEVKRHLWLTGTPSGASSRSGSFSSSGSYPSSRPRSRPGSRPSSFGASSFTGSASRSRSGSEY